MRLSETKVRFFATLCAVLLSAATWGVVFAASPYLFKGPSHEWGWYAFLLSVILSTVVLIATYKCVVRTVGPKIDEKKRC